MKPKFVNQDSALQTQRKISEKSNSTICTRFCSVDFLSYHTENSSTLENTYLSGSVGGIEYLLPLSLSRSSDGLTIASHSGAPYGGLCISSDSPETIKEAYSACVQSIRDTYNEVKKIEIRIPPHLVSKAVDTHEWALWSLDFVNEMTYFGRFFSEENYLHLNRNRRRRLAKIDQSEFRIDSHVSVLPAEFELLLKNRQLRHEAIPTHDLKDFETISKRIPGMIETYSIHHEGHLCAIAILFHDKEFSTIQYLAGTECSFICGSQDLLVIRIVECLVNMKKKIIFGTSTEPYSNHKILNVGLDEYKSSFGAVPYTAKRYIKL